MTSFRYLPSSPWWKGNTHIHSTASDGGMTFIGLADLYAAAGYHFLFRTDHWVTSHARDETTTYPLLWLDGVELDGTDDTGAGYHVVALGEFQGIHREMSILAAMESARAQGGILILAHPHWMGNTFEDAARWQFDGVEVYNNVCRFLNGKGDAGPYWSAMLDHDPRTLAFASDDAHLNPGEGCWNGGWIMVQADALAPAPIFDAIRGGRFYSTCGPRFESITWDGERVTVRTSPVEVIRLAGPKWRGMRAADFDTANLTEATFSIPADWSYAYLELQDSQGRRAWSNTLF